MAIPAGRTARPAASFKGEVPGHLQQAMVALAEGEGLPAVLGIVAEVTGCPVAAADAGGRLLVAAGDGAGAILAGTMAMTDLAGMVPGEVRAGHVATGRQELSASVVTLGEHTTRGYLLLIENHRPLQAEAAVTMGQLALAAWLGIRMQKTAEEVEKKYQGEFLRGLLSGQYTSLAEVTARARVWGWDLSQPHVVGVIEFSDSGEAVPEAAARQVASLAGQVDSPSVVTVMDR